MLNAKQVLIVVVVALFIIGVSMEANAETDVGKTLTQTDYHITCGTLALVVGDEAKAKYYAELVPIETADDHLQRVVIGTLRNLARYAEMQGVTQLELAPYAFNNFGCNRPFI